MESYFFSQKMAHRHPIFPNLKLWTLLSLGQTGLPSSGVSVLNGVAQDLGADFGANTTFITAAEITRT